MEVAQLKWLKVGNQCPKSICATFKQQGTQKNILTLQNAQGEVQMSWEGIAQVIKEHLVSLVVTEVKPSEEALLEVLEA